MCKMVIMGKRKDRATKASALMESIRQSISSASSSSHPTPMSSGTVPPGDPPLIVRPPTVDSWSTGSPSAFANAAESAARCIVKSARIKLWSRKSSGVYVLERRRRISFNKRSRRLSWSICPRVKCPSVRGIKNLVAHDIDCAIQSLVGMRARTFYDLDQEEKWKVWYAMSPKYEWDENDEPMFNWILKRA
ncbi:hypothetical protein ACLB2K_059824 [Fragaria x ananassa]